MHRALCHFVFLIFSFSDREMKRREVLSRRTIAAAGESLGHQIFVVLPWSAIHVS
jgi:hypothetical protein